MNWNLVRVPIGVCRLREYRWRIRVETGGMCRVCQKEADRMWCSDLRGGYPLLARYESWISWRSWSFYRLEFSSQAQVGGTIDFSKSQCTIHPPYHTNEKLLQKKFLILTPVKNKNLSLYSKIYYFIIHTKPTLTKKKKKNLLWDDLTWTIVDIFPLTTLPKTNKHFIPPKKQSNTITKPTDLRLKRLNLNSPTLRNVRLHWPSLFSYLVLCLDLKLN